MDEFEGDIPRYLVENKDDIVALKELEAISESKKNLSNYYGDIISKLGSSVVWSNSLSNNENSDLGGLYKIEGDKVYFDLNKIEQYLESISSNFLDDGWKDTGVFIEMQRGNFNGLVFALQVALSSIPRVLPMVGNYKVGKIDGKYSPEMASLFEQYNIDHEIPSAYKEFPSQDTINSIIFDLKNLKDVGTESMLAPISITMENAETIEFPRKFDLTSGKDFSDTQKSTVDEILKSWKSPVTVEMVKDSCQRHGVPVEYLLAFMQNDSRVGTTGRGAKTHNPGNVLNMDDGSKKDYGTWEKGVDACAKELSRRIKIYWDNFGKFPSVRVLAKRCVKSGKELFKVYMTDPQGPNNVTTIFNKWVERLSIK